MLRKSLALLSALAIGSLALAAPATASADQGVKVKVKAKLSGAAEVPGPGDADGKGKFKATINGDTLCYKLKAKKIEDATAAHIHVGDPATAGPVVVQLLTPTDKKVRDCITAVPDAEDTDQTLSESELAGIVADPTMYYTNVHNADFPSGAIRGQLH